MYEVETTAAEGGTGSVWTHSRDIERHPETSHDMPRPSPKLPCYFNSTRAFTVLSYGFSLRFRLTADTVPDHPIPNPNPHHMAGLVDCCVSGSFLAYLVGRCAHSSTVVCCAREDDRYQVLYYGYCRSQRLGRLARGKTIIYITRKAPRRD